MTKFLLIDGNNIANRAFFALPFLTNKEGTPTGAVYGFANVLIKMILQEKPTHIAVAFDHSRKTFRNEIYSQYKMQRKETNPELISQFPIIKQMLQEMGIKTFEFENIEADDIIGTLSKSDCCQGFQKIILSGDRDLFQLIDKNTVIYMPQNKTSEVKKITLDNLKENFGVEKPEQVIELKGLMGDTSDNISGVKGVGEKTAISLIETYGSVAGVYSHIDEIKGKLQEKLALSKDDAFMSKTLATIKTDCELDFDLSSCATSFPFSMKVYDFFKKYDFSSLLKNNSLFSTEVSQEKVRKKSQQISIDSHVLDQLTSTNHQIFAYNLQTMQFAFGDDKVYFLSQNYDMFGSNLTFEEVCQGLKPLFENKNITKLTFSAKSDMHTLEKLGIKLESYFDLSLANYCISAGLKNQGQDITPDEYFEYYELYQKQMKELNVTHIYNEIELPLINILKEMEENGFKVNEKKIDELSSSFAQRLDLLSKEIFAEAGEEFNINSPKQVATILFDKLGIKSYNNKKHSTSVGVLDELRFIPIVDNILKYRKLAKLKNTYVDVYKNICLSSGPIIHTTFNQALTSTGRLSSSEPNLQNIPTRDDEGRELRKLFISKFEGGKILSADYNQIELRLLADMSGEENLIEAYNNNQDIHTLTASQIFGINLQAVTADMRREAKAVNFGIIYGISDYGLSQNIKSSVAKAKAYIESYFTRYPRVKEFMNTNVESAKKEGLIRTKFGRVRKIPEINSAKYQTRSFGERVAMNMPLQGTASDIIKIAMQKVAKSFKEHSLKSQLILQIHDELIVDVFKGEEEIVSRIVTQEMQNVTSLKVPLVVSVGIGESLYDCK